MTLKPAPPLPLGVGEMIQPVNEHAGQRIAARIEQIYASKLVAGEDNATYSIIPEAVPPERGRFLLEACRAHGGANTLEIGMAWGLSTLHIFQALADKGVTAPHHVIMDPFQAGVHHNAALRTLNELGLGPYVEFYPEPSGLVLPRLVAEGRLFDFAFVDADHRFDGVFIDMFYVDQLLKPGAVAVFDDTNWDGVFLACRFAETNYGYEAIAELANPGKSSSRPLIRAYRKPNRMIERSQTHFVPFFDNFVSNQFGDRLAASTLRFQGLIALGEGKRAQARRYFLQALRFEPLHLKSYFRILRTFLPQALIRATTGRTREPLRPAAACSRTQRQFSKCKNRAKKSRQSFSLPKLIQFVRYFSNWPEVWSAFRDRRPLPAFQVRGGITLVHGAGDDPLYAFREIFERSEYIGRGFYTPKPEHMVVDVGANNGFFTMYLQWRAPGIRVHCFEPGTGALQLLRENIALNNCGSIVTAHPYAIADSNGSRNLLKRTNSMCRSLAIDPDEDTDGDRVETITLAGGLELCGQGRVDLLKIDIEGGEVELVSGAEPKTWKRVERVVAEIHERKRPGANRIVTSALAAAGFPKIETIWPPSNDGCGILRAGH
jgi:FkbM family methyltransferase